MTNERTDGNGFQCTTDGEAQGLSGEGCPARDVWNDFVSLVIGHADEKKGSDAKPNHTEKRRGRR